MSDKNKDELPPGFRFCPTDEELIAHFLQRKVSPLPYHPHIIPDLDLYPYDPWDLDGKAMVEGKRWYYYSRWTQNRITASGYWKSWGCDEQITSSSNRNRIIGVKRHHVFHTGEAPEGVKTDWMMEEFKVANGDSSCSSSTGRPKRRGRTNLLMGVEYIPGPWGTSHTAHRDRGSCFSFKLGHLRRVKYECWGIY